jgi:hypothetical protein
MAHPGSRITPPRKQIVAELTAEIEAESLPEPEPKTESIAMRHVDGVVERAKQGLASPRFWGFVCALPLVPLSWKKKHD